MADDDETALAPVGRQVGTNLRPGWKPGQSGNPKGVSRYLRVITKAVEEQETPDRVRAVVDAMWQDATAHERFSPAAAAVYFKAVGLKDDVSERVAKLLEARFAELIAEAERLEAAEAAEAAGQPALTAAETDGDE